MTKTSKKQKILYKDNPEAKAEELEQFLFGAQQDAASLFDNDDDNDEVYSMAELLQKSSAGQGDALFFEDRAGGASDVDNHSDEDDQEEGDEGDDTSEAADDSNQEGQKAASPGSSDDDDEDEQKLLEARRAAGSKAGGRRPIWADPEDAKLKVNIAGKGRLRKLRESEKQTVVNGSQYEAALRKQHTKLNPRTSWAARDGKAAGKRVRRGGFGADSDEEADEAEEEASGLLQHAGGLLGPTRGGARAKLASGTIETSRMKDANQHDPHDSVVRSVEFHPDGQLLMTAGLDKRIRLFQVDGVRNPRVQSIFLDDCPVHSAAFACGGSQIVAVGRRPHFYIYDMSGGRIERVMPPAGCPQKSLESFAVTPGGEESCGPAGPLAAFLGDQGYIPLVSLKTKQWIGNLKMSGSVRSAAFAANGNELLTAGGDGMVYTWDMRTRRCMGQMVDMGNKDSAALAVSRDNKYVATGSASGVVNVYRKDQCQPSSTGAKAGMPRPATPTPLKEIMNLTTTVDSLAFSPDSQILAIASRMKKDSMRLVHLPSMTVFSNWPTSRSPLHFVHSLAFSPNGGFLAIGNARGRVLLYRLHHYVDI